MKTKQMKTKNKTQEVAAAVSTTRDFESEKAELKRKFEAKEISENAYARMFYQLKRQERK